MAMTSICQKSICIYQNCRNKGFKFTIKEVWDQVWSLENQFFNISSCKWPSASSLKSFTRVWQGINELLPIYFFIPSTCPAFIRTVEIKGLNDLTNFIDFDWFRQSFDHFSIWNYSSLNRCNSGTRRDIKKLIFAGLSNSAIKTFHFHFKTCSDQILTKSINQGVAAALFSLRCPKNFENKKIFFLKIDEIDMGGSVLGREGRFWT